MFKNNLFTIFHLLVLLFSLNLSASYEAKQAGMSQERLDKIAPTLSKYIAQKEIPGLITAVLRKGRIVHFETQGYADVENKIPLQEDSLFRIYSMTKPVTGVALMILLEEGKIRLDDPVQKFIPDFKNLAGDVSVTIQLRDYPAQTKTGSPQGPFVINTVNTKKDCRARGRQAAIKIANSASNETWRFGTFRADLKPAGRR